MIYPMTDPWVTGMFTSWLNFMGSMYTGKYTVRLRDSISLLIHGTSEFIMLQSQKDTLPKTNIAPENRPLEKEIPIGNHHF